MGYWNGLEHLFLFLYSAANFLLVLISCSMFSLHTIYLSQERDLWSSIRHQSCLFPIFEVARSPFRSLCIIPLVAYMAQLLVSLSLIQYYCLFAWSSFSFLSVSFAKIILALLVCVLALFRLTLLQVAGGCLVHSWRLQELSARRRVLCRCLFDLMVVYSWFVISSLPFLLAKKFWSQASFSKKADQGALLWTLQCPCCLRASLLDQWN